MKELSEYTSEELQDELLRRIKHEEREELNKWGLKPHPSGFSGKDFEIIIDKGGGYKGSDNYSFELFGHDSYYDFPNDCDDDLEDYDEECRGIMRHEIWGYLPDIFTEASENNYESDYKTHEIVEIFNKAGAKVTFI